MRHITIILLINIVLAANAIAQVNRYDRAVPAKDNYINTYVSPDWNSINKAYEYAKSVHDRNAQIIDNMIDAIYTLKSQTENQLFRKKLDQYLTELKNLRLSSLLNAEQQIKKIDWAIRDEIDKFNSGSYTTTVNSSSPNEIMFSYGSYVETMPNSPIREKPDQRSPEIARTNSVKYVLIKGMPNENYYAADFGLNTGYISKAFLNKYSTKEAYDEYYSKKRMQSSGEELHAIYKLFQEAYDKQDYKNARKYIDQLLEKDQHPDLFYASGFVFSAENNLEKALGDFNKAISLNPQDPRYYYTRAICYYHLKDYKNALTDVSNVVKINPEITDAYFRRGLIKSELGDSRGAINDYDLIIKYHIDSLKHDYHLATVYNNKAYCLIELGEYQTALPIVNKALELEQEHWYIWDTRGELYYNISNYKDCVSDMTKAISIQEGGNSYYYRGLARIMLKDKKGCEDLSKAGELGKMEAYDSIKVYCN